MVFIRKDVRLFLLTVSACSQTGSGAGQRGPKVSSVQTGGGNSQQIHHRGMWMVARGKPALVFARQIRIILQNVF